MKKWWIIYDAISNSKEYHNIIKFIVNTFSSKKIPFNLISNRKLTNNYLLHLQMTNQLPDIVLFWCKQDYAKKKFISNLGITIINDYYESLICENKYTQLKLLSRIPYLIPETMFFDLHTFNNIIRNNNLSYPVVIKLNHSTLGNGVCIANSTEDINQFLLNNLKFNMNIIMQEFLYFLPQKVTKVCCYNGNILSCYSKNGSDLFKHSLTLKEKKLISKTIDTLNLNFCSIDLIYKSKHNPLICEVNNLPNILTIFKITNINIIEELINFYNNI